MKRLKNSFIKWLVVSMLCLLLGFLLGKFKQDILRDTLTDAQTELHSMQLEKVEQVKQVAHLQALRLTDQQTITYLDLENKKLNEALNAASNKLYFYERVLAPELEKSGVKVYSFTLTESFEAGRWDYELVLMQAQKERRFLKGQLEISFSVSDQQKLKRISLKELSDNSPSGFKFKYFQTIKGRFTLPADITVDEVIVNLKVKGDRWYKAQQLEQRYDWRALTEKNTDDLTEFDMPVSDAENN
ncbi:DUF6776 family protein [Psychromonas ossibalaenae]|uniref:DUF6776 family protein n=1 Tax=Psychromonas ossibalaenae TaxID=444922 RepID=UPI00036556A6|nr:DUF6776 family protein [Psychromonas ossibalaenae]